MLVESFFRTHKYLVEHLDGLIERQLMNTVDWSHRLIAIKGARGVGKTSFLLQYAKKFFDLEKRECLYINLNHFYFTVRTIVDFAQEFVGNGGKTLLLDQIYKYPNWGTELRQCYELFPQLNIVFTGSTVMSLQEDAEVSAIVRIYNLRGFSYREFLNILLGTNFKSYGFRDIIENHVEISNSISKEINPLEFFWSYLHHGYYPFFLEKKNFSENLLKIINMMLEIDVLSIQQIELSYLPKLRKLLYLLSLSIPSSLNISNLSQSCEISRATVTNYLEYLKSARLINTLYKVGEEYPKKPGAVYMHNTNLFYLLNRTEDIDEPIVRETFFFNQVHHSDCRLNKDEKNGVFIVTENDDCFRFKITSRKTRGKGKADFYYALDNIVKGNANMIPLWLFGFLY